MDETTLTVVRAAVAFLVGGAYVAAMARAAEHLGSKTGGLLLAMPSTIFVGVSFIAWSEGTDALHQATSILPATIAAAVLFLIAFVNLARRSLLLAYVGAIGVWLAITVPFASLEIHNLGVATAIAVLLFGVGVFAFRSVPHRTTKAVRQSARLLAMRFCVAGLVSAATVVVAHFAGAFWGGVCASYPAVFSASLFILVRSHGVEFTTSVGRTMIFGGMANAVFALALYGLTSSMPAAPSIALAYAAAIVFAVVAHRFLIESVARRPVAAG